MTAEQVFSSFSKNFAQFAVAALTKLESDPDYSRNAQLYHYTSMRSLEKIIETHSLQSTSIYMMNDPNEMKFGHEHLKKQLPEAVIARLRTASRHSSISGFPAFVFCLTELSDDMYCWDKYGAKHKGIRIGFTPVKLREYWSQLKGNSVFLTPVIYQHYDGEFFGIYAEEFRHFWTVFLRETLFSETHGPMDDSGISTFSYCLSLISSMLKREEWALEKEWRIVSICPGQVSENIVGGFTENGPVAKLTQKSSRTLELLTNRGHDGVASKDVLKVGSLAGNLEYIEYVVQLLMKRATGDNYYTEVITKSEIQTR